MLKEIDKKCSAFCYIGSVGLGGRLKQNVHDYLGAQWSRNGLCMVINVLH